MGAVCSQTAPHQPKASLAAAPAPARPQRATTSASSGGGFVVEHAGNIGDVYDLGSEKIGEGSFGSVCRGKHKATGVTRAIKAVPKGHALQNQALYQEIATMKEMDHPHIIKLFETFEDRRRIFFAMEICEGGELFDRILEARKLSEGITALVMKQVLHAVFYMHDNHLAHRDLKPENFLFLRKDALEGNVLKLIDFGLATPCQPGQILKSKVGTPFYMAPQVLMRRYDTQCDMWSVGVIMYTLLCGRLPFNGATDDAILAKVRAGSWRFEGESWTHVSEDAKTLVRHLLKMRPQLRYTAEQALNHDWIKHLAPRASDSQLDSGVLDRLKGLKTHNKLKKAALAIAARELSDSKLKQLRETFQALDANGDGKLSMLEITSGIEKAGLDTGGLDFRSIVANMDCDGSGSVDYTEFLSVTMDTTSDLTEDVLWTAFNVFDQDGDGRISAQELSNILCRPELGKHVCKETVTQVMKEVDTSGDGVIEFAEFMDFMRNTAQSNVAARHSSNAAIGGA